MADYLLRAPEQDMARWKADAASRGVPFSQWLRDAANTWMALPYAGPPVVLMGSPVEAEPLAERLGPDGGGSASTGDAPSPGDVDPAAAGPVDLAARAVALAERMGKRVRPDPK